MEKEATKELTTRGSKRERESRIFFSKEVNKIAAFQTLGELQPMMCMFYPIPLDHFAGSGLSSLSFCFAPNTLYVCANPISNL